jgi:hypothetical protein
MGRLLSGEGLAITLACRFAALRALKTDFAVLREGNAGARITRINVRDSLFAVAISVDSLT